MDFRSIFHTVSDIDSSNCIFQNNSAQNMNISRDMKLVRKHFINYIYFFRLYMATYINISVTEIDIVKTSNLLAIKIPNVANL